jgi:hypothetical protein
MSSDLYPVPTFPDNSEQERGRDHTILCLRSNLSFSVFAFSYSPFSKCRWSGLSRESVGGSFSFTMVKQLWSFRFWYKVIDHGVFIPEITTTPIPEALGSAHSMWSQKKIDCTELGLEKVCSFPKVGRHLAIDQRSWPWKYLSYYNTYFRPIFLLKMKPCVHHCPL